MHSINWFLILSAGTAFVRELRKFADIVATDREYRRQAEARRRLYRPEAGTKTVTVPSKKKGPRNPVKKDQAPVEGGLIKPAKDSDSKPAGLLEF